MENILNWPSKFKKTWLQEFLFIKIFEISGDIKKFTSCKLKILKTTKHFLIAFFN